MQHLILNISDYGTAITGCLKMDSFAVNGSRNSYVWQSLTSA
jgi:hypothetical protein